MAGRVTAAFRAIQRLKGNDLVQLICEAIVNPPNGPPNKKRTPEEEQTIKKNPFARIIADECYMPSACGTYRDMAEIFIWQRKTRAFPGRLVPGSTQSTEYVSMQEYIKEQTKYPLLNELPEWLFQSPDIEQITWLFFNANQDCFDHAIDNLCRLVYHGMPFYKKGRDDEFIMVPFDDDDYIYLSKKSEHGETRGCASEPSGRYPKWAEEYFFRIDHFRPYVKIFGRPENFFMHESAVPLRAVLRQAIGIEATDLESTTLEAPKRFRLVPYVKQVLSRDCPGLFSDDVKAWPKQDAISKWLQSNKKLSKRQADAVALVSTQSK